MGALEALAGMLMFGPAQPTFLPYAALLAGVAGLSASPTAWIADIIESAPLRSADMEDSMTRTAESVYRVVDVVGESATSWEEAGRHAVETAATSIRDLRVAEVVKMDMKVEDGKVTAFRTRVALSFKYEA
jgi:flavin-binding protein dodecin